MGKVSKRDALGDRMKRYEDVTRFALPKRTYTILRVDGRAFHTWTRGLEKPYDLHFMKCMDKAAIALCEQIAGAQFAYVQSDEISVLAVDFLNIGTEPWFEGAVQKWASVSASIATMAFNRQLANYHENPTKGHQVLRKIGGKELNATFDARVFTIPDLVEVENYFVWRQQDAERNSVTMLAQAYASHKQLHGKKRSEQHEIIHKAGDNWAVHPTEFKHGRVVCKEEFLANRRGCSVDLLNLTMKRDSNWIVDAATPTFTKDREYLRSLVPLAWDNDLLVRKAGANG